jgi:thiamine-monophosphate kinase
MKRQHLTEDSILKKIMARSSLPQESEAAESLVLGMGDDAALFRPKPAYETILTCDWFLEGTHFLRHRHPPDSVGWKCLARAVSDVAAMGGMPRCFLLSLALPASLTGSWLDAFLGGLRRASRKFQCALAGGDTTRRDEILISVTVIGEVKTGQAILRSGARAGDVIYVSGRLGEAELGLQILSRRKRPTNRNNPLTRKHLYPEPRLELGRWLAEKNVATAMMDLSDGLSSDLLRLCAASGVGAFLDREQLPAVRVPQSMHRSVSEALQLALHGGDDYELLFTAPPGKLPNLPWKFKKLRIHPIGVITSGQNVAYREKGKSLILRPRGWDPFSPLRKTSLRQRLP